jgi:hypothetical protein
MGKLSMHDRHKASQIFGEKSEKKSQYGIA